MRKLIRPSGIFASILLALFSVELAGQSGQGATPLASASGRPAGSYQISDIENINYFTGKLNISIPLKVVQGRGSVSYPINVHINSSNWSTNSSNFSYPDGSSVPVYEAEGSPSIGELGRHSWKGSFIAIEKRFSYEQEYVQDCYGYPTYWNTVTRLYVMMPDGTETELRDALTDGQPGHSNNVCGITNRGKIFVSMDGSGMMFKS